MVALRRQGMTTRHWEAISKEIGGAPLNPELDDDYKKLLYARLEHVLLNYDDALINYSKVTQKNNYYDSAQYWYERIKSSQSVLKTYEDIFSPLTNLKFSGNL